MRSMFGDDVWLKKENHVVSNDDLKSPIHIVEPRGYQLKSISDILKNDAFGKGFCSANRDWIKKR